ncbi:phosphate binding protein [Mycoplasmopsis californica]|uniref:PstS family phosphate ABC transporter substrate-binding protein n=1 Tax=Mycoplasmopsis equigenitalium TaxID=114883 RepID=A0ABY5J1Q9_9BACT|nr:PstS family phosphate ABC transporter substrate-binding protein [Mycoplasmopsis equigenitalium]UUD36708.1 PstS family phosphate ABC transporter substrate-binding protein [Mycoplasmopsis equigenitalium]VEU69997.1 phosphate binding protein [Mycoplasmopsis californica]
MTKKKFLLFTSLVSVAAIAPVIVVSCAAPEGENESGVKWEDAGITGVISGQGSSSIVPIINKLAELSGGNLSYKSTGSGGGFKSMNKATPDQPFGMTSSSKTPGEGKAWANTNLRTVTWALDAIGIVVHLPEGVTTKDNAAPIVDIKELAKAYKGETVAWDKLITNLSAANSNPAKVFGRKGGKGQSGTADGFMSKLTKHISLGKDEKSKYENHDSSFLPVEQTTDEANTAAFTKIDQTAGSLTYVSLGFGLKNVNDKVKLAVVKISESESWVPKMENVTAGSYKWTRPFNIIFDKTNQDAVKFTKFLLSESVQNLISSLDFVPLTKEQYELQKDLTKSDAELYAAVKGNTDQLAKFKTENTEAVYGLKV